MEAIVIIGGLYLVGIIVFWLTWETIPKTRVKREGQYKYSIIVPFRNEESHLPDLLKSFEEMDKGQLEYEIILVDDHSTDQGLQCISNYSAILDLKVLHLEKAEGKKQAIALGISTATGQVIMTTDADCRVSKNWLISTAYFFEVEEARMVLGLVYYRAKTFFEKLQRIEFASLVGAAFSSVKLGTATMANGANFSYLKAVYEDVNGFEGNEHLASGDDEFLLHKVHQLNPEKISVNKSAHVLTAPNHNFTGFLNQRLRWAGKWRHYKSAASKLTAVLVLLVQLFWVAAWVGVYTNPPIAIMLALKYVIESTFLYRVLRQHIKITFRPDHFLILQIIYPIYVIVVGLLSNFGSYSWKERDY